MFPAFFGKDRKKRSICIIEDEKETAELLCRFLEGRGYRALSVSDGPSGLERISSDHPDLVLLDLMMPGMSGFEVLSRLKSDPRTSRIPVLVCSALNDVGDVERCCQSGAEGYINKPFELDRIARKVGSLLASAGPI
jgi:CheY-like chemotaxis protein